MTRKPLTNIAASVKQRLLTLAREREEDFNFVLQRFVAERLLYRLSRSSHAADFSVKGATLFGLWVKRPHRATRDIDLLGRGTPELARFTAMFREICSQEVVDDGLFFLPDSVRASPIREDALYEGIRVELEARLGNARLHQQVDIGFGDAATPRPTLEVFPTLLEMPAPRLRAYRRETVVAEKLEAMVKLGMLNSRMKDFFDLRFLAENFAFEGALLAQAIEATFRRREVPIPAEPQALTSAFSEDPQKQLQWAAFLNRSRLGTRREPLATTIQVLREFLVPVLEPLSAGGVFSQGWKPGGPWRRSRPRPVSS